MFIINVVEVEVFFHEAYVFVDSDGGGVCGLDGDVLLADGFDESNVWESFLEAGEEGEGCGCFSDVLFCGGDEDGSLGVFFSGGG